MTLIERLWKEFRENTLEELKLLLLNKLCPDGATSAAVGKVWTILSSMRARIKGNALIVTILGVEQSVVHDALCDEEFCYCHPDGEIKLPPEPGAARLAIHFPLPSSDTPIFTDFLTGATPA